MSYRMWFCYWMIFTFVVAAVAESHSLAVCWLALAFLYYRLEQWHLANDSRFVQGLTNPVRLLDTIEDERRWRSYEI